MENNNFNDNDLLDKENIFAPDYFNQNIQNNKKFKTWENLMFQKYGNNARLFKCTKDKIYFYVSNEECMEYPYYSSKCPICNNVICYYCLRNSTYIRMEFCKCCIRRRLYYLFHQGSQEYINPIGPLKDYADKFENRNIIYLIPFLNIIYTIGAISSMFFYKMYFFYDDEFTSYEGRIGSKHYITFPLFLVLNALFAISLSVCFFIYNIYFLFIIWMISFPFKLIPIKFIAGVLDRGFAG